MDFLLARFIFYSKKVHQILAEKSVRLLYFDISFSLLLEHRRFPNFCYLFLGPIAKLAKTFCGWSPTHLPHKIKRKTIPALWYLPYVVKWYWIRYCIYHSIRSFVKHWDKILVVFGLYQYFISFLEKMRDIMHVSLKREINYVSL